MICTPCIGLGSRFVEEVRTEYPHSTILSVAIAPHSHGESPLQHYNSLLALSHLQQFADGVVLFQNDSVLEDVMKTSQKSAPGKVSSCSLDDMNAYIGGCMANALMPIYTSSKRCVWCACVRVCVCVCEFCVFMYVCTCMVVCNIGMLVTTYIPFETSFPTIAHFINYSQHLWCAHVYVYIHMVTPYSNDKHV